MMLEIGTTAIDFTLPDEQGNLISLHSFKGKKLYYTFIQKIIPLDAASKPAPLKLLMMFIKETILSLSVSVRILHARIYVLKRNTICLLFYYPMRNIKSLKHMMSGKRKNYMVKPIWALRAVPM